APAVAVARLDEELTIAARGLPLPGQVLDLGQGRRVVGEFLQEAIEGTGLSLDFDPDAARAILDESAELEPGRQAVDKRPEADPLNDPLNSNGAALHDCARRG